MRIKSRGLSIFFKLAIVVFACSGLELRLCLFTNAQNLFELRYFTLISNAIAGVYFLLAALRLIFCPRCTPTLWPAVKGIATMALTLTMLVAHFMLPLEPELSLTLLHYVVPIMVILDFLLFDEKGLLKGKYPFIWACLPAAYAVMVFVAVSMGIKMGLEDSMYPYPFMDVDANGAKTVAMTCAFLMAGILAGGYLYVLLDKILYKLGGGKKKGRKKKS